ncbi:MAG TPA: ATP-binding protein [Stellaceae bacterium]|nr:ATP-binding protein [Stellaceae bacterium]
MKLTSRKLIDLPHRVLISVCALGLLSIGVLWTALLYDESAARDAALRNAELQTESIAVALREHVHSVIATADLILQRVDDSYLHSSGPYALPEWVVQSQFLKETLIQVAIIGADGHVLVTTLPGLGQLDLSDREHFRVHLHPGAPQPFISRPVIGRLSHKPSIQITRRIERPDGSFAGVGVVALDPAYFDHFFESLNLGPNSLIFLVGRDGVLRARASRVGTIGVGHDFSGSPVMKVLLSAPQGTYRKRSDLDGIERIYAFAADPEYPLIVAAATAVDDILGARRWAETVEFAAAVALSAVILWLVFRCMQELSKRVDQEKHLRQVQKFEAIGQLTAGVAHDFNNILTAIKGNVERAAKSEAAGDLHRLLGNVELAAQQGERIVRNLLAYSRQQRLQPEAINVNEVVRTIVELLQAGLGSMWRARCELAADLPPVTADAGQVETALLNLAINARDAMPGGGTVVFETRLVHSADEGNPQDLATGNYVAISARDDGRGMPTEVAARAFDPFFTTKQQGTGLGLSQVYGLAKQLGGTAKIDTVERGGTTVTIYLPVAATQVPRPRATEAGQPPPAPSKAPMILVADDDAQVREFICAVLAEAEYTIVEAEDGPSALAALKQHPFELAVLDVSMPGMSGIDVCERARRGGWGGAVLFVSGFTDATTIARLRDKPFLAKPFRAQALKKQVARLVARSACRRRNPAET